MKIDGAGRARESLFRVKTVNCKVKFIPVFSLK